MRIRNPNNILHISDVDLDGSGCQALTKFFFPDWKIFAVDISSLVIPEGYSSFIFTDLCPTQEMLNEMHARGAEVHICDHHPSSREALDFRDPDYYHYDVTKSSCKLYWEFLQSHYGVQFNPAVEEFVKYVNAYDLFLYETPEFQHGKDLHNVLYGTKPQHKFFPNQIVKFYRRQWVWLESEKAIIETQQAREEKLFQEALSSMKIKVTAAGQEYIYFEAGAKISLTCLRLKLQFPEYKLIVVWNTYNRNERKFSARGEGARQLAEKYRGGGHDHAAGFVLDPQEFQDFKTGALCL